MAKKYSKRDYLLYITLKAASIAVSLIPPAISLWIGRVAGLCSYHLHPKRKRIAYANLKAAFSGKKSPGQIKAILRKTYKNSGQSIMETLSIPRIDKEYLKRRVRLEGRKNFDVAEARGKGIIFLSSHFGNWEILGLKSAQEGYPVYILARPQRIQIFNDILTEYREKLGCKVISRGMSFREIIRALKDNNIVGILSDQDVGKAGVFIDLFGRPASHPVGAVRLARDTDAAIVPAFIVRENGAKHFITLKEHFTVPKTDDRDADIKKGIETYIRILEPYIERYPDQWMWVYTRWKSTPSRKVVILNDRKAGHLNQSLTVFNVIKRCRRDAGFSGRDTSLKVLDVKYKNRVARMALSLYAVFASHRCQGRTGWLKLCLTEESYKEVVATYSDIVISCGSALSPVNILLSLENNSKNVIIMKPGIFALRRFNVAVIPRHDNPKKSGNVVITEGAPNLIDAESMRNGRDGIRKFADLSGKRVLGLLLGGDNRSHTLTLDLVDRLISQVETALERFDMELIVTTSRRTPRSVEERLKERLGKNPRCKLLIIANEANVENAVSGILDLSEVVMVSGESISMVSEAASSGKHTIVFDLKKRKGPSKHDRAINRLYELDYIVRPVIDEVCNTIENISKSDRPAKKLDDAKNMYKELYRII